ncbi:MAG: type VI secretion system contractile sheath small subunit [Alphaproteobacteria bacterium]
MTESTQHTLDRVRSPRVQITYDVEIGDAIEMKELPFVMGIIADLSGDRDPEKPLHPFKERKFTEVDRDNLMDIMSDIKPRVTFQADDVTAAPAKDGTLPQINVLLQFAHMDDFDPVRILNQVPTTAGIYGSRRLMHDLMSKVDGNDTLAKLLAQLIADPKAMGDVQKSIVAAKAELDKAAGTAKK